MKYVNILSIHTDSFQFMVVSTLKYIQRNKILAVIVIHFFSINHWHWRGYRCVGLYFTAPFTNTC